MKYVLIQNYLDYLEDTPRLYMNVSGNKSVKIKTTDSQKEPTAQQILQSICRATTRQQRSMIQP